MFNWTQSNYIFRLYVLINNWQNFIKSTISKLLNSSKKVDCSDDIVSIRTKNIKAICLYPVSWHGITQKSELYSVLPRHAITRHTFRMWFVSNLCPRVLHYYSVHKKYQQQRRCLDTALLITYWDYNTVLFVLDKHWHSRNFVLLT